ncbi:hypothetical protein HHK36_024142 [Tetracentron sinense]|uniref:Piwi domain-containing protein n=1 Tax=Tetracentron sinense TaxID=13715 RepID=A0A835D3Z7_TETSI|nr:hypothetical protein HHK36_024142 [Tetracentron sinense]
MFFLFFFSGEVKRICETELGIVSQCCLARHVCWINNQYMANVVLKINVKVGGRNTVLEDALLRHMPLVSDKPTIIFGADVTHPVSGEDCSPSIAAVVASQDWPEVTKYACLVSAQDRGKEIIQDLFIDEDPARGKNSGGGMIMKHLTSFSEANSRLPERIIFFRDGVSESQFRDVLEYELRAIKKAWIAFQPNKHVPPITFVVVQKRHHMKLFPCNHEDSSSVDRSGNILPDIESLSIVDLVSIRVQAGRLIIMFCGMRTNSRQTNSKLSPTTAVIHMQVAPAYYAHLAAFRARFYLGCDSSRDGCLVTGSMMDPSDKGAQFTQAAPVPVRELPALKENLTKVMFYC